MSLGDHIKKLNWYIIAPIFPFLRDFSKMIGMEWYKTRQPYHLGWLSDGRSPEAFETYLTEKGFDPCRIAWIDNGEVIGLRLRNGFRYQYHVRLFHDREIRCHYELTPEYDPVGHLKDADTSERREEFLKLLGDWVVSEAGEESGKMRSQTAPATSTGSPYRG